MKVTGAADHAHYMYGADKKNIRANESSRTWITPKKTAIIIKKIIDDLPVSSSPRRMLNMTANCGGDLLPFVDDDSYEGRAYELSPEIWEVLVDNVSAFDNAKNWDILNASSIDDDGVYDFVVVDPPFGDEYKAGVTYQPRLGPLNMSQLVNKFATRTKYMLLKLPMIGFDMDGFVEGIAAPAIIDVFTPDDLRGMDGKVHKILIVLVKFDNGHLMDKK